MRETGFTANFPERNTPGTAAGPNGPSRAHDERRRWGLGPNVANGAVASKKEPIFILALDERPGDGRQTRIAMRRSSLTPWTWFLQT